MKLYKFLLFAAAILMFLPSCSEDFLDAENTGYLSGEKATELGEKDPELLNSYLRGAWAFMVQYSIANSDAHDDFSYMSVLHSTDMMCEDITMMAAHWFVYDYDLDNRDNTYRRVRVDWIAFYTLVAKACEIIGFFPEEPTDVGGRGILGQAYALRGMAYYYLIQLFQNPVKGDGSLNLSALGVPLRYSALEMSEEEQNKYKGRNTVGDVFNQIESDLTKSVELLDGYSRPSKVFINQRVAYGLLARYYLLTQQWAKAASAAQSARQGFTLMGESGLHDGFYDIENTEWMWGFDHTAETSTVYASFFSHISDLAPGYAGLGYAGRGIDARLYSRIPATDYRKSLFNGPDGDASQPTAVSRRPYATLKFGDKGDWTMDYVYMRAAEMYLIEAEALAHQGREADAAIALARLMANRDPAWAAQSVTVEDVYLQRRIELWGEGFGYFDLKRLNKGIDRNYEGSNHLTGYKHTVPAQDPAWIYQIPLVELQENKYINAKEEQNP